MGLQPGARWVGVMSLLTALGLGAMAIIIVISGFVALGTMPIEGADSIDTNYNANSGFSGIFIGGLVGVMALVASILSCCSAECSCELTAGSKGRNIVFIVMAGMAFAACMILFIVTVGSTSAASLNKSCFQCMNCEAQGWEWNALQAGVTTTCHNPPANNPNCFCDPDDLFERPSCACALTPLAQQQSNSTCPDEQGPQFGTYDCYVTHDSDYFGVAKALAACGMLSALLSLVLLFVAVMGVRNPDIVISDYANIPAAVPGATYQGVPVV